MRILPLAMCLSNLKRQLIASNSYEQLDKLFGSLKVVLPRCDSDEETSQNRLANIHRIEQAIEARIGEPHAHLRTNQRLELAH